MKTMIQTCVSMLVLAFMFGSCNGKKENENKDKTILTERIQYDVFIKSPDANSADRGWWDQNIEGSQRETFVKTILQLACDGKVRAFDYFNEPLTPAQVKSLKTKSETKSLPDLNDPSRTHDTVIKTELDIQSISKVRFLEEWYLDEKKMSFDKKVVGLMLMKESYRDSTKYNEPLFWVYFDDRYPVKLK